MKIQARSTYNGLVQEVDINMAHCSPFCHEPPEEPGPLECDVGEYTMVDGLIQDEGIYMEAVPRDGSTYGAVNPNISGFPVFGYLLANPFPSCVIDGPEPRSAMSLDLLVNGASVGIAGLVFEDSDGRYYIRSNAIPSLPVNSCITIAAGQCSGGGN
jgi:hypothetical protein